MDNDKSSIDNVSEDNNRSNVYSKISFILAVIPIAVLLIGFIYCLLAYQEVFGKSGGAAIWIAFSLVAVSVISPVGMIMNILSVIFGVIGLKRKKTAFAWLGIKIACINVMVAMLILGFLLSN